MPHRRYSRAGAVRARSDTRRRRTIGGDEMNVCLDLQLLGVETVRVRPRPPA
jgi:hypothetical protein